MRIILSFLIIFFSVSLKAQSELSVDSLIHVIDHTNGKLIYDTVEGYRWNPTTGKTSFITVTLFKLDPTSKKLLKATYENDKESISFYYNNKSLIASKIHSISEFGTWKGKTIYNKHAPIEGIIVSDPGDESEYNVSQLLASYGYSLLKLFDKVENENK